MPQFQELGFKSVMVVKSRKALGGRVYFRLDLPSLPTVWQAVQGDVVFVFNTPHPPPKRNSDSR